MNSVPEQMVSFRYSDCYYYCWWL